MKQTIQTNTNNIYLDYYGLLDTHEWGKRLVEWRSEDRCWDQITDSWLVNVDKSRVDFNLKHIVDFLIENKESAAITFLTCEEILEAVKERLSNMTLGPDFDYFKRCLDYALQEVHYVPKYK